MEPSPDVSTPNGTVVANGSHFLERVAAFQKLDEERVELLKQLYKLGQASEQDVAALKEENEGLKHAEKQLYDRKGALKQEIAALKEENEELKQAATRDSGVMQQLDEINGALEQEMAALREETEELKQAAIRDNGPKNCQVRLQDTEQQLREIYRSMETCPFVLVLIDGNAHLFHDNLLRHGAQGGADAAMKLRGEIENTPICSSNQNWKIVVRIFIDFQGLVEDLAVLRNPINENRLRKFVGGFTQVQPLYDIIDTGPGGREALVKMKEVLEVFVENVQCKHTFFGCAGTAAALFTLDAYKYDPIIGLSITFIQSKPIRDPDVHIAFETIELPSVFRFFEEPEKGAEDSTHSVNGYYSSSTVGNWNRTAANRSRTGPSRNSARKHMSKGVKRSTWGPDEPIVLLNINDERVDLNLPKIESKSHEDFEARHKKHKLCHFYYLTGKCPIFECTYSHASRLSSEELLILRGHVRHMPCNDLVRCRKPACVYGHICPFEKSGSCPKNGDCQFKTVHNIHRAAVTVWQPKDGPRMPLSRHGSENGNGNHTPYGSPPRSPLPGLKWSLSIQQSLKPPTQDPAIEIPSSHTSSGNEHVESEAAEAAKEAAGFEYKRYFTKR